MRKYTILGLFFNHKAHCDQPSLRGTKQSQHLLPQTLSTNFHTAIARSKITKSGLSTNYTEVDAEITYFVAMTDGRNEKIPKIKYHTMTELILPAA